jgi:hypothetical protein
MKTYKFNHSLSNKIIILMVMVICLFSCAKQEILTDLDFQKSLLAGSGSYQNTKRTWKIDSLTQNGVVLILSTAQKRYTRTFNTDGTYSDSDGNIGAWLMPSTKDLTIISNNGISKIKITNKYEVVDINSAQLHLKYDSANIKQELYFIISN